MLHAGTNCQELWLEEKYVLSKNMLLNRSVSGRWCKEFNKKGYWVHFAKPETRKDSIMLT